eukprot:m.94624 g.94624  ORF g.94624 m.94624 type:complete len:55 (+) comp36826_c0_seq1:352-516(+)
MASYHVFDVKYPAEHTGVLQLLQVVVMQKKPKAVPLPTKLEISSAEFLRKMEEE